ncbi:hypothetical protein KSD_93530 [Ktedonobacter sp. SOSP1-85]|uniref:iron reductase n=1 Tax=Ktedonobacter sp. SOSP1-85 TaxID=2778367 RepID=UPI001A2A1B50|nr:iron reductase [Ktedonobacter sp. SOSP1-85]GHO81582.1 hypothetical protein KSD_93530 [Ktedonobacter sp. SOSP1-85]
MNVIWQDITWDVARAGGFTSYILLTLAVFVGLALSTQVQSRTHWPRLINSELHNFLTLLSTTFLGIHIAAVWVDPFTHFGWREILLPFASHYRPLWMALGIIGLYLGLAIGLSTLLRPRIGYTWWKRLHVLTLAIFVLAGVHGIMTGSDTHVTWAMGIYVASFLLVTPLLSRRILAGKKKSKRALKHRATTTQDTPAMSQQKERSLPTRGVAIHQP